MVAEITTDRSTPTTTTESESTTTDMPPDIPSQPYIGSPGMQ